jgi:tetratricopeptide (TPR) repeat protein
VIGIGRGSSRVRIVALSVLALIALAGPFAWISRERYDSADLARARREVSAGEYAVARGRLVRLASHRSGDLDIAYLLGLCEREAGRPEDAIAAWSRIPAGSAEAPRAALAAGKVLSQRLGRFADAESSLRSALAGPPAVASEARWSLVQLLIWEGRIGEARRLLEEGWSRTPTPERVALLREHWRLDVVIVAEDELRPLLEAAERQAPGDPRIALARASLATRYGRFDEAKRALDACLELAPEDAIARRARLDWARAADRPEEAARAIDGLASGSLSPAEVLALRAWLAGHRSDRDAERSILATLVELDPGDSTALERLAVLSQTSGDPSAAERYRLSKAEADRRRERYRWALLKLPAHPGRDDLEALAGLAESLGRTFEAEGWWELVVARAPGDLAPRDALDRLGRRPRERASLAALKAEAARVPSVSSRPVASIIRPTFVDAAGDAGLRGTYESPHTRGQPVPEVMGGGGAFLDYDRDGSLDVFQVQGGAFPPGPGSTPTLSDRLFHNRGDGTFEDVSARAGFSPRSHVYGFGVTVGDYNNDGYPDLFLTRWRSYALFRNRGDGTFEDVTTAAGLGGNRDWPTSAAFADFDNDGDLDLYVCHYLAWNEESPPVCTETPGGRVVSCLPLQFPAEPDHLFRNDGGRFVDVSKEAGIAAADANGRGLGVVAADLDGDGLVDLYVANDQTPNYLFRNCGGLRFEEVGFQSGAACGGDGLARAGMGVACGDLDGDGRPDLAVTNFFGESTTLYRNLGGLTFADATAEKGLGPVSRFLLGFGIAFLDANNDGFLDLAVANGHVNDVRPTAPFAMPSQLLVGDRRGRLSDVSATAGEPWRRPVLGRGLASGDFDNDGRVDVLFIPQNSPLILARNTTPAGHFVTIRLEGTSSNRDAIGARVKIQAGERSQTCWRSGGGSYLSASDPRLHFGLGTARKVERVEVTWPSGRIDVYLDLAGDARYSIREGTPAPLREVGTSP